MLHHKEDIGIESNFYAHLRHNGKVVPGSYREGHNVFTVTGRNLLSRLTAWSTVGSPDIPFTNRRPRWMGVGTGSQLEVSTVEGLVTPQLATPVNYLVPIQTVNFPDSTSVSFIREFGANEVTVTATPVTLTEAGLFADVLPASAGGTEDVAVDPGNIDTTLNPAVGTNPPIAYRVFEPLTKTVDFILQIRWELRFV